MSTVATLDAGDVTLLLRRVAAARPDFILVEGVMLLDAMKALHAAFPALPLIVDFHNVEGHLYGEIARARLPVPLRPLAPLLLRRRLAATIRADREAAVLSRSVWVCSQEDLRRVREVAPDISVSVLPNPVPDWCRNFRLAPGATRDILFVGHLGYRPNRTAVAELARRIMPRLRRRRPEARLHVCGRAPRPSLARLLAREGARLTADPIDLSAAYSRAAAVAIPLREGGGTRIKVIEALAIGCPVVATVKAVEGLGLVPDHHYLRAETADGFADHLATLLADREAAHALAEAGRLHVEAAFGPAARRMALERALALAGLLSADARQAG